MGGIALGGTLSLNLVVVSLLIGKVISEMIMYKMEKNVFFFVMFKCSIIFILLNRRQSNDL